MTKGRFQNAIGAKMAYLDLVQAVIGVVGALFENQDVSQSGNN